jgi:PAS domain S-box-containing protein
MNRATRILVVDDEPAILKFFSMILRRAGYEVWEASNGQQCLQVTREKRPDLVLLDVRLPDLNGIDICRQIKADAALLDIFVILVSGMATSAADKVDGAETGADDYMVKPVNPDEFLARIRTIVRLRDTTAALRASEQHYRRLVEILPDAVGMIDLQGRLTTANRQAVGMLGYAGPGELLGKNAFDLMPPEEHERMKADLTVTLETGVMRNAEYTMLRKNGSRFPVELSAAVSTGADGQSRGIVIVARDITARQQAEARIRELLHILDQAHDAIIIHDLEGRIHYFNKGAERILGWTADEVRGRCATDLFFEEVSTFAEAKEKLLQAGEWDGELHILTRARQPLIVHSRWTLVHGEKDQSVNVVCINTDLTKQKRTEEALKEREELSQKIIGTAMEGFWMLDLEGNLVDVNEAYCRMSGYSRQELLSMHTSDVEVNEASPKLVVHHIQRIIQSGSDRFETRHRCKDGRIIEVEVIATFLKLRKRYVFAFMRDITERKRAEQLLRASQERFQQLAENIREVFWITNPAKNEMIYISPGYEEIWGRTCESLYASPMGWVEAIHPDDRERVLESALTKQTSSHYDEVYRIVQPAGSHRWIHDRAFPIRDDSGEVYRVVGIAEDITERKLAETRLATLVHAVESTAEMICITDIEDRFTFVNRAFGRAYGYTEVEILGKTPDMLFSPNNPPPLLPEILKQTRLDGWRGEVLDRRKDGTEFPVFLSTSKIVNPDGRVIGLMGVAQDITERKRAEEQIRLLAYAVQSARDLICITDGENRFTFVNQSFVKAYGYRQEEVLGRNPDFLQSPKNPPGLCEHIFRQTLGSSWRGELLNRRKDGTEFPISLSTSAIKNSEGRTIGLIGVASDITERKRAEEELRRLPLRIIEAQEAERLRVARELHDGVNQLIASAKMRLRKVEDGAVSLNPAAREILARCSRLLVQALEENRRIAHNLRPSDLDEFGLAAASRNFCEELRSRTKLKVKYSIARIDQRLAPALELNLFRIMQEAVNNIEKHAHAREVRLRIAFHGDSIVLKIQDDGRGFDSKRGRAGKGKWRGIGLTNMRERAEFLGGTCAVESAPKQGTTITVRVPCGGAN